MLPLPSGPQAELRSVLYPLFVHCYLELISKNHPREGAGSVAARGRHRVHRLTPRASGRSHGVPSRPARSRPARSPARSFFDSFKGAQPERYATEVQRLGTVDAMHMKDHDLVTAFRTNKFNVRLCSYSFELLMEFCLDRHYLVLLRLMNQHMNIQGRERCPAPG